MRPLRNFDSRITVANYYDKDNMLKLTKYYKKEANKKGPFQLVCFKNEPCGQFNKVG